MLDATLDADAQHDHDQPTAAPAAVERSDDDDGSIAPAAAAAAAACSWFLNAHVYLARSIDCNCQQCAALLACNCAMRSGA